MHTSSHTNDIDFLPQAYREQGKRRQRKLSRYIVVAIFASLLLLATAWQLQLKRQVQRQIDEIRPLAAATATQQMLLAAANEELAALESKARLYALLKHRWPTTQVLAATLRDMPREIQVTELSLQQGPFEQAATRLVAAPPAGEPEQAVVEEVAPPVEDFENLLSEAQSSRTIVRIEGFTNDPGQLHRYLGRVASSPLIDKAVLESLEAENDGTPPTPSAGPKSVSREQISRAKFRVKLLVSDSLAKARLIEEESGNNPAEVALRSQP